MKLNRKDLLNLPVRKWNHVSEYDSIYLVNTSDEDISEFSRVAIIGIINNNKRGLSPFVY